MLWIFVFVLVSCFVSGWLYWFLGGAVCFSVLEGWFVRWVEKWVESVGGECRMWGVGEGGCFDFVRWFGLGCSVGRCFAGFGLCYGLLCGIWAVLRILFCALGLVLCWEVLCVWDCVMDSCICLGRCFVYCGFGVGWVGVL